MWLAWVRNEWRREMNEPIDELISYADHTHDCMVSAGHDECTCKYDDAEGKAQAAWDALKAENARLAAALREAREALFIIARHPIKHDPQAYAVVRGIAETAIDDANAALRASISYEYGGSVGGSEVIEAYPLR